MARLVAIAVLVGGWLSVANAAELPRLVARRAPQAPALDGTLTDRVWKDAFLATRFALLGSNSPPSQATAARVLYDEQNLYVGFDCDEDEPEKLVTVTDTRDGPAFTDDCVELFVSPGPDPADYYHFVVNARGVLRDEHRQDASWDSGARAAATQTAAGWSAELVVPLADLNLSAFVGKEWRVNFAREERPHGEISSWAPCQGGFHEPAHFGRLTDVNLDVTRYARAGLSERLRGAWGELRPALQLAQGAASLRAGRDVARWCERARSELSGAEALVNRAGGGLMDLQEAEAAVQRGLVALAGLRTALPKLQMSLALQQAGKPTDYAVCRESSMARLRPQAPYAGMPADTLSLSLARREYEAVQVVVVPIERDLQGVRVTVSDLKGKKGALLPAREIAVDAIGYVNIKEPSGRSGAAPGLYPDPLLGDAPQDIDQHAVGSWLVTVHAPPGQAPGTYVGRLTVAAKDAPSETLPFTVTVWSFELPRAPALRTCFQLIPSYLWKAYRLPAVAGVPAGWDFGVWTGADVEGRANYFGRGVFLPHLDPSSPHGGRRALRIEGQVAEPGAVEAPRACYERLFKVEPQTEYEVTVWYRTRGLADDHAALHVHTHNAHLFLKASEQWAQARLRFNSRDIPEARVYLCNAGVGDVWFDDVHLGPVSAPDTNLVDDPGFEQGGAFEQREELLRAYRVNSLEHRCSDMNIAAPTVNVSPGGEVNIDWTDFDREIRFYLERGLNAFNVSWAQVPGGWGSVSGAEDEKAGQVSAEILRQTQEHLQANGWLDLAYLYTIDEPGHDAFPAVQAVFDRVHRAAPKIKRLLTFGYGASRPTEPGNPLYRQLTGSVDIWVPHSDCFEPKFLEQRRRAGDEIWEYVCISAQKPYASIWAIDCPGTDPRVVFWQCYAQEITGFLYWATDYWEKNPWEDPLTYPGGNSDGSLFYPGPDRPVNSLRWETIRDGIEDYDYLALLNGSVRRAEAAGREAALCREARRLLNVSEVTRSYTQYSTSPAVIEGRREAVARMLERLGNGQ